MSGIKWYHTQRWRRRAALQLKRQPLCAICLQNGQVVPTADADHVGPHKGDEWAFWYGDRVYADRVIEAPSRKKTSVAIAAT